MCYVVYLATDCPDDLSGQSSDLVRFEEPSRDAHPPSLPVLNHEHKWFVGSKSGCSCTFRHVSRGSADSGFRAPEDWLPEKQDEIEATHQLYATLRGIVQRGYQVQLLDCLDGDEDRGAQSLDVSVTEVSADHFRLFEGRVFNLKP